MWLSVVAALGSGAALASDSDAERTVSYEIVRMDGTISSLPPDGRDGRWLAGTRAGPPCGWPIDTRESVCAQAQTDVFAGPLPRPAMAWSPDSAAVAFTEDWMGASLDADVHVLTTAGAHLNLTDDGFAGRASDGPDGLMTDTLPSWVC